jgi:hypothetical protein
MTERNAAARELPPGQMMTLEKLLVRHDMKPTDEVFVEERPDGIFT